MGGIEASRRDACGASLLAEVLAVLRLPDVFFAVVLAADFALRVAMARSFGGGRYGASMSPF